MEAFCRTCLVKFDDASLLQYSEKTRRLFVYSTGLQIKRNDNIAFHICKECYSCMKIACTFKKNSRSSDKKIKSFFALKDDGDSVDLITYLKNNDDTVKFRYPMVTGSSTPAHPRKDDDNESTCTSIQNFMSDILPPEEIPDNEAKIIKEVIEEEADILEDSLDSHWLQDDASIETDSIRFNFNFSPFATPRLANSDHCYTPRKDDAQTNEHKYSNFKNVEKFLDSHYGIKDMSLQRLLESSLSPLKDLGNPDTPSIQVASIGQKTLQVVTKQTHKEIVDKVCSIDKNLENALRKDNESYPLDLILTPTVAGDISAPPTPLITNILFGDKIDDEIANNKKNFQDDIEYIDEFLNTDIKEEMLDIKDCMYEKEIDRMFNTKYSQVENTKYLQVIIPMEEERIVNEAIKTGKTIVNIVKETEPNSVDMTYIDIALESDNSGNTCINLKEKIQTKYEKITAIDIEKFNITNFYCKMCNKQFEHLKGLKIHSNKYHGAKIDTGPRKARSREFVCHHCGKIFRSSRTIINHLKIHGNPDYFPCKYCTLDIFTSEHSLKKHMSTHIGSQIKTPTKKNFVCPTCGKSFATSSNYRTHERRHTNAYSHHCALCGLGFVTSSELRCHMIRHTGDRPHLCTFCMKSFARSDTLNKHIKSHTGEKPFECSNCQIGFTTGFQLKCHLKKDKCINKEREEEKQDNLLLEEDLMIDNLIKDVLDS